MEKKKKESEEENRFWEALIFIVGRVARHNFTREFTATLFRERDLSFRFSFSRVTNHRRRFTTRIGPQRIESFKSKGRHTKLRFTEFGTDWEIWKSLEILGKSGPLCKFVCLRR